MATKNLARTVLEGGRYRQNKLARRYSNRSARRANRDYARDLLFALAPGEDTVAPMRKTVAPGRTDRLGAPMRWLASFVGRPWNEARAAMAEKFDTRTLAGRHIVIEHLLRSVRHSGCEQWIGWNRFVVDDDGILRGAFRRR